ncbi:hypothetical protein PIB30_027501 [Stylosanthes scabra]|uniref:Peroxidase n=1 Tax=Stylosanthes scabra TaxID=79078 RepID=A0ABU6RBA5_9FABA|nr:hypothetical protein [Stylosanthes scabra]
MASFSYVQCSLVVIVMVCLVTLMIPTTTNAAALNPYFYDRVCPQALPVIRRVVQKAINRERRMGASLLRLHFHDCFVNGCDGSVLLDDTANFTGEKTAKPNLNSIRGFEVVDQIKAAVDKACKRPVVSCADILALAARDSVAILGGPLFWYQVPLGRRDARNASQTAANNNLPPPFFNFTQLLASFNNHGLNTKDLVALSGAHTIGFSKCKNFRNRIYNDTNIDPNFATSLRANCPSTSGVGDNNLAPLDPITPSRVDNFYYKGLVGKKGILHSDQELYGGNGTSSESVKLVELYSINPFAFARDFKNSMIKMGNLSPLTGNNGEIRLNCRRVN